MKKLFLFALVAFAIGCSKNEGGERGDESTYLRLYYSNLVLNLILPRLFVLIPTDNGRLRVFLLGVNALH